MTSAKHRSEEEKETTPPEYRDPMKSTDLGFAFSLKYLHPPIMIFYFLFNSKYMFFSENKCGFKM